MSAGTCKVYGQFFNSQEKKNVEPVHLSRYVDEQAFRFNNRATKDNPLNDNDRFELAVSQIAGKRLTYKELTGKQLLERPRRE
jgi:hypothetical protein